MHVFTQNRITFLLGKICFRFKRFKLKFSDSMTNGGIEGGVCVSHTPSPHPSSSDGSAFYQYILGRDTTFFYCLLILPVRLKSQLLAGYGRNAFFHWSQNIKASHHYKLYKQNIKKISYLVNPLTTLTNIFHVNLHFTQSKNFFISRNYYNDVSPFHWSRADYFSCLYSQRIGTTTFFIFVGVVSLEIANSYFKIGESLITTIPTVCYDQMINSILKRTNERFNERKEKRTTQRYSKVYKCIRHTNKLTSCKKKNKQGMFHCSSTVFKTISKVNCVARIFPNCTQN